MISNNYTNKECSWHFAYQEGGSEKGPNMAMKYNFSDDQYRALVREATQNSLDAVDDITQPVVVEFKFSFMMPDKNNKFFDLKKHIRECAEYFPQNGKAVEKYKQMENYFMRMGEGDAIGYIEVSDYNTIGMSYELGSTSSPFYSFIRSEGVSSKTQSGTGGSFGFGKAAYFQISPISTLLVSTLTNKGQYVFEGVSRLCTHKHKDNIVSDTGFYDNNGGQPITNKDMIPDAFLRKKIGTSVYIIGFKTNKKEKIIDAMIKEAVRNFWLAIYYNKIIIKIDKNTISRANISEYMCKYFPDDYDNTSKSENYNPAPYYNAVKNIGNSNTIYKLEKGLPILGKVTLLLIKNSNAKDKILYMRRPLMLVYAKRTRTNYGVYGIFICEDYMGDRLLQSMENPAHNEWKASNASNANDEVDPRAIDAEHEIKNFIKESIEKLFSEEEKETVDLPGLDELLYIPEELTPETQSDKDHVIGTPTGQTKDEGISLSPDIKSAGKVETQQNASVGSVILIEDGSHDDALPDSGDSTKTTGSGGHKKKKTKIKGGSPTAGNQNQNEEMNSEKGTHRVYIPVKFRSYAQEFSGQIYHRLIIYCDKDIYDGQIEIVTVGEQGDEVVSIKSCSEGQPTGNIIADIALEKGKNTIDILFDDNMRHTIGLSTYENT